MLHLRRRALRRFRDRSSPSLDHQFQPDLRRRTGGQNSVGDGGARGAERGVVVGVYRRHPGVVVCVPVGDSRWPHLVAQNSCALVHRAAALLFLVFGLIAIGGAVMEWANG